MQDTLTFLQMNPHLFIIIFTVISLFIGSFLNVIIYRLPIMMMQTFEEECRSYLSLKPEPPRKKLNLCLPFSHCPHCNHVIRPWHNIPVISYLFLLGKCADCRAPIHARYPFIELLTAITACYVAITFGFSLETLAAALFTYILIALTFIDLDHQILPDQLTLSLLWLGLFFSIFNIFTDSHSAILGAIAGYLCFASIEWLFKYFTGKSGMGMGDFKLLAALGAFLGWKMLPLIILLASVTGIIISVTCMIIKRQFKSEPFPFGPYLAIAGWIAMLFGNKIIHYYLIHIH